jgi:YbbR domain-containing protein
MKKGTASEWKARIFENGSYKLVALFVTLILWVTILGRRDFVLSKEMDIEFLLPRTLAVSEVGADRHVTVKVSGPRIALKKFAQNPGTITVDLGRAQAGPVHAVIAPRSVEVPFGVKVLSVTPDVIGVTLVPTPLDDNVSVSTGGVKNHPKSPDDKPVDKPDGKPGDQ